jgi:hypothetical protein
LPRRGKRTVMSRPPLGTAVACTVPLWTVAMDDTRVRPRPEPSWRMRWSSRVNGRNRRSTMSAGTAPGSRQLGHEVLRMHRTRLAGMALGMAWRHGTLDPIR